MGIRLFVDSLTALLLVGVLVGILLYHRKQYHFLLNSLIGLLVTGVVASIMIHRHDKRLNQDQHERVHQALDQLQDKITIVGAMKMNSAGQESFPHEISPLWFRAEGLPTNVAVPGKQPWLDIAPQGDHSDQPPDPVIVSADQAGFWYNPNNGVFRARVVPEFSQQATLDKYNNLNNTQLTSLPQDDMEPSRQPRSLFPSPMSSVADSALSNADLEDSDMNRRNPFGSPR